VKVISGDGRPFAAAMLLRDSHANCKRAERVKICLENVLLEPYAKSEFFD